VNGDPGERTLGSPRSGTEQRSRLHAKNEEVPAPTTNEVADEPVTEPAPAPSTLHGPHELMSELARRIRDLSIESWSEQRATEMVGLSPAVVRVQAKIAKIARYDEPVLITGETGAGKEMVAQALYLLSERRGRPYVSVNCALYQEGNLTISELFGHLKGSFTGAIADHKGAFEQANGGVLFLDEIGELHPTAQSMLLRALATGEYRPLGTERLRTANVRVVAATNRSPDELVLEQDFRNDLLFRLHYFHLQVPPLRERGDDWKLVLESVLHSLHRRYGVQKRFSPGALRLLENFNWPGNVRQLVSVATAGYAMADGDVIEPEDMPAQIQMSVATTRADKLFERVTSGGEDFWEVVYRPFMERDINREQVREVVRKGLDSTRGSYQRVLELLRLPPADYQRFMDFLRHHRLKP
jgi:DNA-binding NtrC family response regulator